MSATFGQLVIGPPGSGKSTYCKHMSDLLSKIGRKVALVNIDPANESYEYKPSVDISELITVEDVMVHMKLGPNGGLVYCMEYLEKNIDWLLGHLKKLQGHYLIIDCPGQVELYSHHSSLKKITGQLVSSGIHLATVHLVDSHYCSDPAKYISSLLVTLSAMLQMELPHVNLLSKVDLLAKHSDKVPFGLEYFTEVLDLSYLLEILQDDPLMSKFKKLNSAIVSLVEDYSLVCFLPMNVNDQRLLLNAKKAIDKANGYVYNAGEERNVQALLACAVGAQSDEERLGVDRDKYTPSDAS